MTWRFQNAATAGALAASLLAAPGPQMQGKISGGFQAPSTVDDKGRRSVVKGTDATPQGNNVYVITEPRVTSYNPDDTPDMFIEARKCTLDLKSNVAWSDSELSMRTADGRFALSGTGWQWDPQTSNLSISNDVAAQVQKAALDRGMTNRASGATNAPVRITARRFQQDGDNASFIGEVRVADGPDTLKCARLNLQFEKPGGVQRIEAIQDVELTQADTQVRSGLAVYEMKNETLTITKSPVWNANGREGSAEKLVLDRLADTLAAEGNVFMKLPLTNALSATNPAAGATNQPLKIYSDRFLFKNGSSNRLAEAHYLGTVKVVHPEATISCADLDVGFNREQQVQSLLAKGGVTIDSAGRRAVGETAEYYLAEEKFALLGNPRWTLDDKSGRSDKVVFHPKSGEVHALGHVEMLLPTHSAAAMLPSFGQTNSAPASNSTMRVTASTFSHQRGISVFHEGVKVVDARGQINCQMLTLVSGASNQLQRIVAENQVTITQKDMIASGEQADYNVATGLVHLTGDPILRGPDKSLRSDYFIIDRNANTFSVAPGKYRIEMKLKKGQKLPQL